MAEILPFPRHPRRLQCAVEFANLMVARLVEVLSYKGYNADPILIRARVTAIVRNMYRDEPKLFDGRASHELEQSATEFAYDSWRNFLS